MARKASASEGLINHYTGVRLRVTGSGVLKMNLYSLDSVNTVALPNLTMAATTAREPFVLANFKSQRAQLEIRTDEIDERFRISKIVLYMKPSETQFPGG